MRSTLLWRRAIRFVAYSLFALVAATLIYVPLQQRMLRHRAERLLADIHSLQMGKSTWADAERLMSQWGAWGKYEGDCTAKRCSYQIELDDTIDRVIWHYNNAFVRGFGNCCVNWISYPYELLGGRAASVFGRFEVIDGVVWAKDYSLLIDVLPKDNPEGDEYLLMGRAATFWRTGSFFRPSYSLHPEYVIGRPGGCEGCMAIYARYTPYADPGEVNRLLDFNLDCLNRRLPCLDVKDIMPSVTVRYEAEHQARTKAIEADHVLSDTCPTSLEFLGRDKNNVVLAQIDQVQKSPDGDKMIDIGFRLIKPFKRAAFWKPGDMKFVRVADDWPAKQTADHSNIIGKQYILLFGEFYRNISETYVDLAACEPIAMTEQNLAAVQRGIRKDLFPDERNFWP